VHERMDVNLHSKEAGFLKVEMLPDLALTDVERKMKKHGVFAYTEDCDVMLSTTNDGMRSITVISDRVTGYFFDRNMIEAPSSDMEEFFLDLLGRDETLRIEGSYPDGLGGVVLSQARYRNVNGEVISDIRRNNFDSEGNITEVRCCDDLTVHEEKVRFSQDSNVCSIFSLRRSQGF